MKVFVVAMISDDARGILEVVFRVIEPIWFETRLHGGDESSKIA